MNSLISITLCGLWLLGANANDSYTFDWPWRDRNKKAEENTRAADEAAPESSAPPATLTYLDTLNKGREVALTEKDVKFIYAEPAAAPVQTASAASAPSTTTPSTTQPRQTATAPTPPAAVPAPPSAADAFRIQTLATSDIERARVEKKQLESRTHQPVYIMFEAPYYKIQVGDFTKRPAAEEFLADFRKSGYNDAWIVTVRTDARISR